MKDLKILLSYTDPMEEAITVDIFGDDVDLLLAPTEQLQIRWNSAILPTAFYPSHSYTVSIDMYPIKLSSGWPDVNGNPIALERSSLNIGTAIIEIPLVEVNLDKPILPVIMEISVRRGGAGRYSLWSGTLYLYLGPKFDLSLNLRDVCSEWWNREMLDREQQTEKLTAVACPPTVKRAELIGNDLFLTEKRIDTLDKTYSNQVLEFLHPGAYKCYRSLTIMRYACTLVCM